MSEQELQLLEKNVVKLNETLIPKIVENVSDQKKETITTNLENTLKKKYRDLLLWSLKEQNNLVFEMALKEILNDWSNLSEEEIMQNSIYDASFEAIKKASLEANELALKKLRKKETSTDKETYDRLIHTWETYQGSVEDWNKKESKLEISEGYLDLNFAFGFSKCTSLRLSKYIGGNE